MKLLIMTLLSLILSGCTRTVYVKPEPIQTFFIDKCPKVWIVPTKTGWLNKENHLILRKNRDCHVMAHDFYRNQLLNIKGEE